jgi:hypothetical protein
MSAPEPRRRLTDIAQRLAAVLSGFGAITLCAAGDGFTSWAAAVPFAALLLAASFAMAWWSFRAEPSPIGRAKRVTILWATSALAGAVVWVVVALFV